MEHRPVSPRPDYSFGEVSRSFVLSMIDCCAEPSEKKARIMIAREHGHLTNEEAEEWIVAAGLEGA